MDYLMHYNRLIARGKMRCWDKETAPCYTEMHHIVPKCVMKDNSPHNLVCLTAEEHFIAHQLLVKIYCATIYKHKLAYAADAMRLENSNQCRPMNKEIGWLKRRSAEAKSAVHTGKTVSAETRKKLSDRALNRTPEHRSKLSEASKRENLSDETRARMRKSHSNRSAETRRKNSEGQKQRPWVECPHCGLTSQNSGNMNRYHFNNCKHRDNTHYD